MKHNRKLSTYLSSSLLGIFFLSLVLTPHEASAKMFGWDVVHEAAFSCYSSGGAYIFKNLEYKVFGVTVSSRQAYFDASGNEIDYPCGGGNELT